MDLTDLGPNSGLIALVAAAAVLFAVAVTRRAWMWLFGPVFAYETARLARQGRVVALRGLYAIVLLALLFAVAPDARVIPLDQVKKAMTDFAERFSRIFLVVQAAAVMLLTPLYVAGAVSDEKEKRSLDFLLCSRLHSHEIVLGKLAARLVNVFALLLAGLPVIAVTQLWGGVDLTRVMIGFGATALTALSLGSFGILCSVLARKTIWAVLAAYGVPLTINLLGPCLPHSYLVSPILLEVGVRAGNAGADLTLGQQAAAFAAVHGLVSAACLGLAVSQLRASANPPEPTLDPLLELIPPQDREAALPLIRPRLTPEAAGLVDVRPPFGVSGPMIEGRVVPPMDEDRPLLWKESFIGRSLEGLMIGDMAFMCFAVLVVVSGIFSIYYHASPTARSLSPHGPTPVFFLYVVVPSAVLQLTLGYRLAGSVTREREKRTLVSMLALPVSRTSIIESKFLGAFRRSSRLLTAIALALITAAVGGALHPASALLLGLAVVIQTVFVASLALLVSTVSRSTAQATLLVCLAVVLILVGTWVGYVSDPAAQDPVHARPSAVVFDGFNPVRTWIVLEFGWPGAEPRTPDEGDGSPRRRPRLTPRPQLLRHPYTNASIAAGLTVYLALAGVCLWAAAYRFRRLTD